MKSTPRTNKPNAKQNGSKSNRASRSSTPSKSEKTPKRLRSPDKFVEMQPIYMNTNNTRNFVKSFVSGTNEFKQLLGDECTLVFECKVCRSLFRSVACYMSHKRIFCKERFCDTTFELHSNQLAERSVVYVYPEPIDTERNNSAINNNAKPINTEPQNVRNGDPGSSGLEFHETETTMGPVHESLKQQTDPSRRTLLGSIVQQLSQKALKASEFHQKVKRGAVNRRKPQKEQVIHIEQMPNTTNAVYQTVVEESPHKSVPQLMRSQVSIMYNKSHKEASLDTNGKIIRRPSNSKDVIPLEQPKTNGNATPATPSVLSNSDDVNKDKHVSATNSVNKKKQGPSASSANKAKKNVKKEKVENRDSCDVCNITFPSKLQFFDHVKNFHSDYHMEYYCPLCHKPFRSSWGVQRHLQTLHQRGPEQVQKLRRKFLLNYAMVQDSNITEKPVNNVTKPSNTQSTPSSPLRTELLHQEQQRNNEKAWIENVEDDADLQMCSGCGRKFDRRAALTSHSHTCQKRIALQHSVNSSKPQNSVNSAKPQNSVNSSKPQNSVNSSKPQNSVNSSKPQNSVNSSKPQNSVNSSKPQNSVNSSKPQISVNSLKPQNSINSPKPQNSVNSPKPQNSVNSPKTLPLPKPILVIKQEIADAKPPVDDTADAQSGGVTDFLRKEDKNNEVSTRALSPATIEISCASPVFPASPYNRIRLYSGGSWSETPRKDQPNKKIEIQIRKDYYKDNCSSSNVSSPVTVINVEDDNPLSDMSCRYEGEDSDENISEKEHEYSNIDLDFPSPSEICQKELLEMSGVEVLKHNVETVASSVKVATPNTEAVPSSMEALMPNVEVSTSTVEATSSILEGKTPSNKVSASSEHVTASSGADAASSVVDKTNEEIATSEEVITSPSVEVLASNKKENISSESNLPSRESVKRSLSDSFYSGSGDNSNYIVTNNYKRFKGHEEIKMEIIEAVVPEKYDEGDSSIIELKMSPTTMSAQKKAKNTNTYYSPVMEKKIMQIIDPNCLKCLNCRKYFKNLSKLRRHASNHLKGYRFKCKMCVHSNYNHYHCVSHVSKRHGISDPKKLFVENIDHECDKSEETDINNGVNEMETSVTSHTVTEVESNNPKEIVIINDTEKTIISNDTLKTNDPSNTEEIIEFNDSKKAIALNESINTSVVSESKEIIEVDHCANKTTDLISQPLEAPSIMPNTNDNFILTSGSTVNIKQKLVNNSNGIPLDESVDIVNSQIIETNTDVSMCNESGSFSDMSHLPPQQINDFSNAQNTIVNSKLRDTATYSPLQNVDDNVSIHNGSLQNQNGSLQNVTPHISQYNSTSVTTHLTLNHEVERVFLETINSELIKCCELLNIKSISKHLPSDLSLESINNNFLIQRIFENQEPLAFVANIEPESEIYNHRRKSGREFENSNRVIHKHFVDTKSVVPESVNGFVNSFKISETFAKNYSPKKKIFTNSSRNSASSQKIFVNKELVDCEKNHELDVSKNIVPTISKNEALSDDPVSNHTGETVCDNFYGIQGSSAVYSLSCGKIPIHKIFPLYDFLTGSDYEAVCRLKNVENSDDDDSIKESMFLGFPNHLYPSTSDDQLPHATHSARLENLPPSSKNRLSSLRKRSSSRSLSSPRNQSPSKSRSLSDSHSPSRSQSPFLRSQSPLLRSGTPFLRSQSPLLRNGSPSRSQSPLLRNGSPSRSQSPLLRNGSPSRSQSPVSRSESPVLRSHTQALKNQSALLKQLLLTKDKSLLSKSLPVSSKSPLLSSKSHPYLKSRSPLVKSAPRRQSADDFDYIDCVYLNGNISDDTENVEFNGEEVSDVEYLNEALSISETVKLNTNLNSSRSFNFLLKGKEVDSIQNVRSSPKLFINEKNNEIDVLSPECNNHLETGKSANCENEVLSIENSGNKCNSEIEVKDVPDLHCKSVDSENVTDKTVNCLTEDINPMELELKVESATSEVIVGDVNDENLSKSENSNMEVDNIDQNYSIMFMKNGTEDLDINGCSSKELNCDNVVPPINDSSESCVEVGNSCVEEEIFTQTVDENSQTDTSSQDTISLESESQSSVPNENSPSKTSDNDEEGKRPVRSRKRVKDQDFVYVNIGKKPSKSKIQENTDTNDTTSSTLSKVVPRTEETVEIEQETSRDV